MILVYLQVLPDCDYTKLAEIEKDEFESPVCHLMTREINIRWTHLIF